MVHFKLFGDESMCSVEESPNSVRHNADVGGRGGLPGTLSLSALLRRQSFLDLLRMRQKIFQPNFLQSCLYAVSVEV